MIYAWYNRQSQRFELPPQGGCTFIFDHLFPEQEQANILKKDIVWYTLKTSKYILSTVLYLDLQLVFFLHEVEILNRGPKKDQGAPQKQSEKFRLF